MLAAIGHPVVVVSAAAGERRACSTGTAMYVSLDPPLVAISHMPGGTTTGLIEESGEFSLSVLGADQLDVAHRAGLSSPDPDKFAERGIAPVEPPAGLTAPGVAGSAAILWCRVEQRHPAGDHVVFIGSVAHSIGDDADDRVLLRHHRRYRDGGEWLSTPSPEGFPI
jgi:flavin reductase (DIM6/NTAB) family NADH-FMN oxidoreductase RutF